MMSWISSKSTNNKSKTRQDGLTPNGSFCTAKESSSRVKTSDTREEYICRLPIQERISIQTTYQQHKKLHRKTNPIGKCTKDLNS